MNTSCPPVRLCPSVLPQPTFLTPRRTLRTWVRPGELRQGVGWSGRTEGPHEERRPGLASSPFVCAGAARGGLSWQLRKLLGWAEREG